MGGQRGEVRGKTKIKTYERYIAEAEKWPLDYSPSPKNKKACKKAMVRDEKTQEWVLQYYFMK